MSQPDPQQHAWGAWARVQENVAAAQAAQVAQQSAAQEEVRVHASWIDWGTAFKTAKPHVMQTSLFWNHYSEGNSAFCCLNAEVLSPDRQQRLWYRFLGDADITLKFDIAGGKFFPAFMTIMILTALRLGFSALSPQTDTQANKSDCHALFHGLDSQTSAWSGGKTRF